ncbi:MAG: folate family ECF transporter S component [Oscillospiraceae bacterium]|nr:folate family ECF transporter S component [Oscillospiraceae bacterium]
MKFLAMFRDSARELKSPRCLATTGILCALFVVLNIFAPGFGETLRITFGYLALATIGMLYGPVVAVLAAVPCDVLVGFLGPYAMIPAFIPNRMLEGFIYGIFLYGLGSRGTDNNRGALWAAWQVMRITLSRFIIMMLCYFIINSFIVLIFILPPGRAAEIMSEQSFWAWAWFRSGWKNIAQLPVDLVLMFTLLPVINKAYQRALRGFSRERKSG